MSVGGGKDIAIDRHNPGVPLVPGFPAALIYKRAYSFRVSFFYTKLLASFVQEGRARVLDRPALGQRQSPIKGPRHKAIPNANPFDVNSCSAQECVTNTRATSVTNGTDRRTRQYAGLSTGDERLPVRVLGQLTPSPKAYYYPTPERREERRNV